MLKRKQVIQPTHIQNVWVGILPLKIEMYYRLWKVPEIYKPDYKKFKLQYL